MRGRPTNNRRGPNPLTRSYESNGPDVKIRGNAHHVAEKYLQLARDAHTGGDPVAAENYLQHAEHYFRLIAAAQAAQALAQSGQQRPPGEGEDDLEDDGDFGTLSDRFASPAERQSAYQQPQHGFQPQPSAPNAPQPFADRPAYEAERQGGNDRGGFAPRQERQGNRFPDRGPRPDRPFSERNEGYRDNRPGRDGRPRDFRPYRDFSAAAGKRSCRRGGSANWASVLHNDKPETQQHGSGRGAAVRRGSFVDAHRGARGLVPRASNRRQREAASQPEAGAGVCGRHTDLAAPIQVKQSSRTRHRKSPATFRRPNSDCRRRRKRKAKVRPALGLAVDDDAFSADHGDIGSVARRRHWMSFRGVAGMAARVTLSGEADTLSAA